MAAARAEQDHTECVSHESQRNELFDLLRGKQRKGCTITEEEITIIVLRYHDGATFKEIATKLNLGPVSSVYAKWKKAMGELKAFLQSDDV
jgi:DNA-directed RNA polymerase specialized sigma subunit